MARLRRHQFIPGHTARGTRVGRHASPQRGQSIEFADYREYLPGEDVRQIDWKVYGRSDRFYVKRFEHQSHMHLQLLVDASASMAFRGLSQSQSRSPAADDTRAPRTTPSKYDHACRLAGALGFLAIQQHDRLAFAHAQAGWTNARPAGGGMRHLDQLLATMERTAPHDEARLAESLHACAERAPRHAVLVVLSDLLEAPAPILHALTRFTHHGGDAIVFQILHRDELHLPDWQDTTFIDSETDQRLELNLDAVRHAYHRRVNRMIDHWRDSLHARGIAYHLVPTDTPCHEALLHHLAPRSAPRR